MTTLQLKNLSFKYSNSKAKSLKNLNLTIESGEFIGITGVNGSGKTTLSYCLNGLIPHQIPGQLTGQVLINNQSTEKTPIKKLTQTVGLLLQNPDQSLFNLTVESELMFGLNNFNIKNPTQQIKKALKLLNISHLLKSDPQTLSFGQKQKVALACLLVLDTPILVLDEPTAMLDYPAAIELYQYLNQLNHQGKTIIVIDHHTEFLAQFAKRLIILSQGQIKLDQPVNQVFKQSMLLKKYGVKQP